ncbi:MAG TPA: hypothetical protein VIL97_06325 [Thermoanaerobaculia bacterium]
MQIDAGIRQRLDDGLAALHRAVSRVDDEMFVSQMQLAANLLASVLLLVSEDLNARRAKDAEFALNDLLNLTNELSPDDRAKVEGPLSILEDEIESMKSSAALPEPVFEKMKLLQSKLRERRMAIERQTFRPPENEPEPLPHDPQQLRAEAAELQNELTRNGFETPTLDRLVQQPQSFQGRDVSELIEELDVIIT